MIEDRILQQLGELKSEVTGLRGEVGEVKGLAEATNGRLKAVELWKAHIEGVLIAFKGIPTVLTIAATVGSIVAVIVALNA